MVMALSRYHATCKPSRNFTEETANVHLLGLIDCEPIFLQHLEEHSQVMHMLLQCGTGNQMVIQVSEHKREVSKKPIH